MRRGVLGLVMVIAGFRRCRWVDGIPLNRSLHLSRAFTLANGGRFFVAVNGLGSR